MAKEIGNYTPLSLRFLRRQCASRIESVSLSDPQVLSSTWSAQP